MTERVEMVLIYKGKEVARASVIRQYRPIEDQRYRWVHSYGLTRDKDWQIFIQVPSTMGYGDPILFRKLRHNPFKNQNLKNETESTNDSTDRPC